MQRYGNVGVQSLYHDIFTTFQCHSAYSYILTRKYWSSLFWQIANWSESHQPFLRLLKSLLGGRGLQRVILLHYILWCLKIMSEKMDFLLSHRTLLISVTQIIFIIWHLIQQCLMGPRGACSLCTPNERPAEPLLHLNLSRLWADICTDSQVLHVLGFSGVHPVRALCFLHRNSTSEYFALVVVNILSLYLY